MRPLAPVPPLVDLERALLAERLPALSALEGPLPRVHALVPLALAGLAERAPAERASVRGCAIWRWFLAAALFRPGERPEAGVVALVGREEGKGGEGAGTGGAGVGGEVCG